MAFEHFVSAVILNSVGLKFSSILNPSSLWDCKRTLATKKKLSLFRFQEARQGEKIALKSTVKTSPHSTSSDSSTGEAREKLLILNEMLKFILLLFLEAKKENQPDVKSAKKPEKKKKKEREKKVCLFVCFIS